MRIPDIPLPKDIAPKGIFLEDKKNKRFDFGSPPIRNVLSDPDKDGFPTAVDCEPHNPRKQGALSWIISKVKRKPYQEVETERYAASARRHEWRLKRLQYQKEEVEAKRPIEQARAARQKERFGLERERIGIAERRTAIMERKQKSIGKLPSLMGPPMGKMPSLMGPSTEPPKPPEPAKKKRRRGKKKSKGRK